MPDIIQIVPLAIKHIGNTSYVNVYGLSKTGNVYTWDAKKGKWVLYTDAAQAKAFTPPKEVKSWPI